MLAFFPVNWEKVTITKYVLFNQSLRLLGPNTHILQHTTKLPHVLFLQDLPDKVSALKEYDADSPFPLFFHNCPPPILLKTDRSDLLLILNLTMGCCPGVQ